MNLYQIPSLYQSLDLDIEAADGELTPEMERELLEIQDTLERKGEAICFLVRNALAEAEVYKAEAHRLAEKARVAERRAGRLKDLLLAAMKATGTEKLRGELFQVRLQKAPNPRIRWLGSLEHLPNWCRREIVELDGTKAYGAWKAGASMEGFSVEHAEFLVIR